MSVAGPPIPLVVGQTAQVPQNVSGARVLAGVMLTNLSPYLLRVQAGALQDWIAPFQAWPMPATQLGLITVTPQLVGTAPAGSPASLVPTYYLEGETVPPPQTLVAAALSAAISGAVSLAAGTAVGISSGQGGTNVSTNSPPVNLGAVSVGAGSSSANLNVNVPADCTGLIVVPLHTSTTGQLVSSISIVGTISLSTYASASATNAGSDTMPPVFAAVSGVADNPYTVGVNLTGAAAVTGDVAYVYGLIGTGAQQVFTTSKQPLDTMSVIPGLKALTFNVFGVSGTAGTIVPASAGKTITVYGWHATLAPFPNPAVPFFNSAQLQAHGGSPSFALIQSVVQTGAGWLGTSAGMVLPGPIAMPVGVAVDCVLSTGGGSIACTGAIYCTVQ